MAYVGRYQGNYRSSDGFQQAWAPAAIRKELSPVAIVLTKGISAKAVTVTLPSAVLLLTIARYRRSLAIMG